MRRLGTADRLRARFRGTVTAFVTVASLAVAQAGDPALVPSFPTPESLRGVPELPDELHEGWYARLDTERGTIVVRLLPEQAPQSVAYFAALAEGRLDWIDPFTGKKTVGNYYDGIVVHKAVAGERIEAGDKTGTGRGAPPYYVPPEGFTPVNFDGPWRLGNTRFPGGKISAVVFFLTAASQPWLNAKHPCFGEIVAGKEVVWNISLEDTLSDGMPREPVLILRVRVFAVGEPAAIPEPVPYEPVRPELKPKPQPVPQ